MSRTIKADNLVEKVDQLADVYGEVLLGLHDDVSAQRERSEQAITQAQQAAVEARRAAEAVLEEARALLQDTDARAETARATTLTEVERLAEAVVAESRAASERVAKTADELRSEVDTRTKTALGALDRTRTQMSDEIRAQLATALAELHNRVRELTEPAVREAYESAQRASDRALQQAQQAAADGRKAAEDVFEETRAMLRDAGARYEQTRADTLTEVERIAEAAVAEARATTQQANEMAEELHQEISNRNAAAIAAIESTRSTLADEARTRFETKVQELEALVRDLSDTAVRDASEAARSASAAGAEARSAADTMDRTGSELRTEVAERTAEALRSVHDARAEMQQELDRLGSLVEAQLEESSATLSTEIRDLAARVAEQTDKLIGDKAGALRARADHLEARAAELDRMTIGLRELADEVGRHHQQAESDRSEAHQALRTAQTELERARSTELHQFTESLERLQRHERLIYLAVGASGLAFLMGLWTLVS